MTGDCGIERLSVGTFFRAFLANPRYVASAVPSSPALAALMVRDLPAHGPIIELGPGTGVFTRAMLGRGIAPGDLHLVERHPDFARKLAVAFPGTQVHNADAGRMPALFGDMQVAGVVSGLPLLSLPKATTYRILDGAFRLLAPGGVLVQFTYGPRAPVPRAMLTRLGLRADFAAATVRNFPPARVYHIRRAAE